MKRNNNSSGMTIVEVLVSVIIISLVMGVLFALLLQIQKASTDIKKKSSLLISQNVVTKAVEKDMIEIGVKAISKCSFEQFGFNPESIDTSETSNCVRIEYNQSYDISDVGYILIYKQKSGIDDSNWVIRYGKGYYKDCTVGKSIDEADYGSWKDTYSVVQKLDSDTNLVLTDDNTSISVNYTANYDIGKKYSEQKENMGNLFIPISDTNGFNYNIDLSFSFRLNDPVEPTYTNPKSIFSCDKESLTCNCSGSTSNCDKTKTKDSVYQYVCSEEKESVSNVIGMNKNFIDLPAIINAKLYKNRISSIKFEDSAGKDDITGIDVSYSQNGSTILTYRQDPAEPTMYNVVIYQLGGVSVYGNSLSGMFKGFTNLKSVDFEGFNSTGITNINSLFYECSSLVDLVNFNKIDLSLVKDVSLSFYKCSSLTFSPFKNRTDLYSIKTANSVFVDDKKLVGTDGVFDYNVEFPAYNVSTLNSFLKNTGVITFIMNGEGKSFPSLKNFNSMLSYNASLIESTIVNINAPKLVSMGSLHEEDKVLVKTRLENIITPNLQDLSSLFKNCAKLADLTFNNFDTHNVTDFSRFMSLCASLPQHLDLSMLSFENATIMDGLVTGCTSIVTLKLAEEGTGFNLDKVVSCYWMLGNAYNFQHFEGSKFTMHNCKTAYGMFYATNRKNEYKDVFDISFLELRSCTNFGDFFHASGYRAINMSGYRSTVTDTGVAITNCFCDCKYLTYVYLNDFGLNNSVNMVGMFDGCIRLTFVDGSFTEQDEIDRYLMGEGDYVLNNGKSPFDNFLSPSGYISNMQRTFRNCSLLRGIPDGYLDNLRDVNWCYYNEMFKNAFSATISKGITIDQNRYKEIYKVVLPFRYSVVFESATGMFNGCTNLAAITFKNGRTVTLNSTWDTPPLFTDLGKRALEDGRIDRFVFNIDSFVFKINSYKQVDKDTATGMRWIFGGFNINTYANNTGKIDFVLSSDCNIAKTQYKAFNSDWQGGTVSTFNDIRLIGPSGCSLS